MFERADHRRGPTRHRPRPPLRLQQPRPPRPGLRTPPAPTTRPSAVGFVTGDTAALTRLATPDCAACQAVVAGIADEKQAGTTYRGGEITAFETVSSTDVPQGVDLVVRYSTRPFQVSTSGASPTIVPGANAARTRVGLQRAGSGWLVRELEPLTAP